MRRISRIHSPKDSHTAIKENKNTFTQNFKISKECQSVKICRFSPKPRWRILMDFCALPQISTPVYRLYIMYMSVCLSVWLAVCLSVFCLSFCCDVCLRGGNSPSYPKGKALYKCRYSCCCCWYYCCCY